MYHHLSIVGHFQLRRVGSSLFQQQLTSRHLMLGYLLSLRSLFSFLFKVKPGFHSNARNATHTTQALALRALRKRKTQETQALALATMIGCHCFDRAFLLAGACVRCVKNRIGSIVAFSYAMTDCVSCVTCACVFLFFDCVIFLRLLRTLILLAYFFLRKALRALRAFEWKPGFTSVNKIFRRFHGES